jgi:hypothetical protein
MTLNIMSVKEIIKKKFDKNFEELFKIIDLLSDDIINHTGQNGTLCPGQLIDQILKISSMFINMLNGKTMREVNHKNEIFELIIKDFINYKIGTGMNGLALTNKNYFNKEKMIADLNFIHSEFNKCLDSFEPAKKMDIEDPIFGSLTEIKVFFFINYHIRSQIHQLKNILAKLGKTQFH